MATRVYGVLSAPGVRVEETTPAQPTRPGQIGSNYIVGAFMRGAVGGPNVPPIICRTLSELKRRRGVKVEDYYAEQACRRFLQRSAGAGTLYTERVTHGTEGGAAGGG